MPVLLKRSLAMIAVLCLIHSQIFAYSITSPDTLKDEHTHITGVIASDAKSIKSIPDVKHAFNTYDPLDFNTDIPHLNAPSEEAVQIVEHDAAESYGANSVPSEPRRDDSLPLRAAPADAGSTSAAKNVVDPAPARIQTVRGDALTRLGAPVFFGPVSVRFFEIPIVELSVPAIALALPNINDPYIADQWGLDALNIGDAWQFNRGQGIIVAVIDSGAELTHPDLAGQTWINPGEIPDNGIDDDGNGYIDDVNGWDFRNDDNNVFSPYRGDNMDHSGHGLHIAGIIGALADNEEGIAGVAPLSRLMILKGINDGDLVNNQTAFEAIIDAVIYAADMGAKVINMSLGLVPEYFSAADLQSFEDAINYAAALGAVIVTAAGNENGLIDEYPAVLENVITVGALRESFFGNTPFRDSYSDYGPELDIMAPGTDIVSLRQPFAGDSYGGDFDYTLKTGTSMAVPHISGVIALMLSQDPTLGFDDIYRKLTYSAVDLGSGGFDDLNGFGMVNPFKAISEDYYANGDLLSRLLPVPDALGAVEYRYDTVGRVMSRHFVDDTYTTFTDYFPGTNQERFQKDYDANDNLVDSREYDADGNLVDFDRARELLGIVLGIGSPATVTGHSFLYDHLIVDFSLIDGGTAFVEFSVDTGLWYTAESVSGRERVLMIMNENRSRISERHFEDDFLNERITYDVVSENTWLWFQTVVYGPADPANQKILSQERYLSESNQIQVTLYDVLKDGEPFKHTISRYEAGASREEKLSLLDTSYYIENADGQNIRIRYDKFNADKRRVTMTFYDDMAGNTRLSSESWHLNDDDSRGALISRRQYEPLNPRHTARLDKYLASLNAIQVNLYAYDPDTEKTSRTEVGRYEVVQPGYIQGSLINKTLYNRNGRREVIAYDADKNAVKSTSYETGRVDSNGDAEVSRSRTEDNFYEAKPDRSEGFWKRNIIYAPGGVIKVSSAKYLLSDEGAGRVREVWHTYDAGTGKHGTAAIFIFAADPADHRKQGDPISEDIRDPMFQSPYPPAGSNTAGGAQALKMLDGKRDVLDQQHRPDSGPREDIRILLTR